MWSCNVIKEDKVLWKLSKMVASQWYPMVWLLVLIFLYFSHVEGLGHSPSNFGIFPSGVFGDKIFILD